MQLTYIMEVNGREWVYSYALIATHARAMLTHAHAARRLEHDIINPGPVSQRMGGWKRALKWHEHLRARPQHLIRRFYNMRSRTGHGSRLGLSAAHPSAFFTFSSLIQTPRHLRCSEIRWGDRFVFWQVLTLVLILSSGSAASISTVERWTRK